LYNVKDLPVKNQPSFKLICWKNFGSQNPKFQFVISAPRRAGAFGEARGRIQLAPHWV
jgi:hypothetical protein